MTQRHEQLISDYDSGARTCQDLFAKQVTALEDRDFGNSVESVQEKIHEFHNYTKADKPKQQGKLLETDNVLGVLHASQSHNERPKYKPEITQTVLEENFQDLESASTGHELALNETLANYMQYRLVVEQFNARAAMVESMVANVNKMFDKLDASDLSVNNLNACLAAHKKYMQTISRYDVIVHALPDLVEQVQEPYCDASKVRQRLKDLIESLKALKVKAEKFNKTASDSLQDIKNIRDLLLKYRNEASNLNFEAKTLLQKAEAMRLGDTEKFCEDQLGAHAAIMKQMPELEKQLDGLSAQYSKIAKVDRTGELPEQLRIQALESQLKELSDAVEAKKKVLEDALAAQKAKAATKAAELSTKHEDLIFEFENTASEIKKWIAEKHKLFSSKPDVTTVEEIQLINDDFKTYRGEEKPAKQKQLFHNQDIIGQLLTSQRQNGMELFEPTADFAPKALSLHWSEMETAEVGYVETIENLLSSYKDQRRFTAEHDKKAKNINNFVHNKKSLFASKGTEVPSSDRVAVLEERVKDHRAYEREVGRLGHTIEKMQKLADSINPPYESNARIDVSQEATSTAVKELAEIAQDFGEKNKALLIAEEELARKAKQYNNDVEGFLFLAKFAIEVLSDHADPETSERAKHYLNDHKEFVGDTVDPLKKEFGELGAAAEELSNAGRADYIDEGYTLDKVKQAMNEVTALEAAREENLQNQVEKLKQDEEAQNTSVSGTAEELTNSYNENAIALNDWMVKRKEKFGETDFRSVQDCEDASQQLKEYRATAKPEYQALILSLGSKLGTLHSLQRANGLVIFEPTGDLNYATLLITWDGLNEAEAAYEKTLLEVTDAYTRMSNCVDEFDGTNELISKWATDQSVYFTQKIHPDEAKLPPADRIHQINERLQRHDIYQTQYARYEPVAAALTGLLESVQEPYQDAPLKHAALKTLQEKLAALVAVAAAFKKENDDLLATETHLQTKNTTYIQGAEKVLFDIQSSVDKVNEPFHASGIPSVEAEKANFEEFLQGECGPDSLGERVEALVPAYTELKSTNNSDHKDLCPSELQLQVLRDAASNLKVLCDVRSRKLEELLVAEQTKESTAKEFAVAANAFGDYCSKQHDAVNGASGDFDDMLKALRTLDADIKGKKGDLTNCYALQKECDSAGVTVNPHTSNTVLSLQAQYDELNKLLKRAEENTEAAKAAKFTSKLTPDQTKMLKRVFKELGAKSDTMTFDEFYQACNAMGLFIDETTAKDLFKGYVSEAFNLRYAYQFALYG